MEQQTAPAVNVTGIEGLVIDAHGVAVPPRRPFLLLDEMLRKVKANGVWESREDMVASIEANAPKPDGLPQGSPNPNDVYSENGVLYRFIVDPDFAREMVVRGDSVKERIQFKRRPVALSLVQARRMTDSSTAEEDRTTDWWNGFTWMRGGYSPERDFTVIAQAASISVGSKPLVFEADANPSDVARLRHEMSRIDRNRPALPVMTEAQATSPSQPLPADLEDVLSEPDAGPRTRTRKGAESESP